MSSLNKCIFIGNVGKIETRYMPNGDAVTNFSIAVNEKWKDKSGDKQENTEWINCIAFRRLAEVMQEYVKVGQQIYVDGKMQTRKWQTKEGQDRYSTEIIVNEMKMLGGKRDDNSEAEEKAPAPVEKRPALDAAKSSFESFDDDIGF